MAHEGVGERGPGLPLRGSDRVSLERAIEKFASFHESERGFAETMAFGRRALPALRELLLAREPSGLFQLRCLTAKALGVLGAPEVLIEFLGMPREIADPVERVGEDAVINAAARALAGLKDARIFDLLMGLAEERLLPGVLTALGTFKRPEALAYFVAGLAEDECRPAAEAALRELGPFACNALISVVAKYPRPEGESSLRGRRSAIGLLREIGVPPHLWAALRQTISDPDAKIAALACMIGLVAAPESERSEAAAKLTGMLEHADPALRIEIEECLARFDCARKVALPESRCSRNRADDPP